MYIQDFPRCKSKQSLEDLTQFAKDLLFFVRGQRLSQHILDKFLDYNFEKTTDIGFVHSMSGEHLEEVSRHGKNGLASTIKRLGLDPSRDETLQLGYVVRDSQMQLS
jgi:hypothetical protein